jgi:hypothetical protein
MGAYLDQEFAHTFGTSKTYFGLENGMFCVGPAMNGSILTEPVSKEGYECVREEIVDWDSSWYSPICRGWFKQAKSSFDPQQLRGMMTNLYTFASNHSDGKTDLGLTSCAPIQL